MRYLVAQRPKLWGWFKFKEACSHRHTTVAGAQKCAEHLNAVYGREQWTVADRESFKGGEPVEIAANLAVRKPKTVSGEV